ncbi:Ribonuclease [Candidatus Desulfarcum epimagneticum]|uniref:Ribonuclease G n=1 Tax=uncultured Desulfobacteraceae bacterium TaxID=218296 RepID=A0A484HIY2_9BACT|nr:Ribonuclease [uncultured Desulfobacteraceae bacterium]
MTSKILINAVAPEVCRIAKVKNSRLEEFHIETASRESLKGNIYKAVVARVEQGLQAVFVNYGVEKNGFLQKHEIHPDYFQGSFDPGQSIKQLVKTGQEILVQVMKDPIQSKGAMLTTFISLAGRHIVLMPGGRSRGISRKIEGEEERYRLKDIMGKLKIPEDFGVIIRTAGSGATKTAIEKDIRYLMRVWKNIKKSVMQETAPALLYKERNLLLRSMRDYFTPDVSEILVDDVPAHREAKKFLSVISPKHTKIVKLHKGDKPIFTKFQLEDQINSIYESRVNLKSGGSIVIEQTEALVSVDVNSGKATGEKTVEQTALNTNLEAAEEIARQLCLRDLGGIIAVDFIDMKDRKHNAKVEQTLKSFLKKDKAKTKVGKISRFGVMEMSRQRIRPSIDFGSFEPCPYCRGKGMAPSVQTLGLSLMRKLQLKTLKDSAVDLKVRVPEKLADYLLNKKRKDIHDLEAKHGISITIQPDASLLPEENRIVSNGS